MTYEMEQRVTPPPVAQPAHTLSAQSVGVPAADDDRPARATELGPQAAHDGEAAGTRAAADAPPAPLNQPAMQVSGAESARLASDAAAHERERRSRGAIMPRRLLLTVSDATRMTQLNSLVRAAGYEARAAFDGQQALDLLRIERPDLLLLDYELNGINGVETLRRLRQQGGGRVTLPVVMLLPSEMEGARREALELGAASVITTPYDPANLLESVRQAAHVE